ncbi:MAG: hypothetical protein P8J59_11710 [Phycisphaerales bacterium]|nr:hypothetical protein [Phycisphaerales bacterium]
MTPVLRWIKSHLVVVICAVVIVVAPLAAWYVSTGMTAELKTELQQTASRVKELDRYKTTTVALEVPGGDPISIRGVVNPRLLEAYEEAVTKIGSQAEIVHAAGLARNQTLNGRVRGADDLLPGHFPAPSSTAELEEMPFLLHDNLVAAYRSLLSDVRAGVPPTTEDVSGKLSRRRDVFVSGARKDAVDDLDEDETEAMRKELTAARLNIYRSHVLGEDGSTPISFYASPSVLPIPPQPTTMLPPGEMFEWQWQFWVTEDLLHAFAAANGDGVVIGKPMKRLLSLNIAPLDAELPDAGSSGGSTGFGGGSPGMGSSGGNAPGRNRGNAQGGGDSASTAGSGPADPGAAQVDPSASAAIDKSVSITGRTSNSVYDVRNLECTIVVATRGLPAVIDAIAAQNFMTVLDVQLLPANAFAAASEGFIYGIEPVSTVKLQIETIWLREWTADAMPGDLREALGIKSAPRSTPGQAG